ncbi:MAG TPA: hypothetical protein VMD91_17005 [Candidatus Sulfotelmatobacter sp.]|nr:hypothetical protein [Candidatus Sulfotelmatobacter sp.]
MTPQPTVVEVKSLIDQLSRTERTELTHWLLQRYIAGGSTDAEREQAARAETAGAGSSPHRD